MTYRPRGWMCTANLRATQNVHSCCMMACTMMPWLRQVIFRLSCSLAADLKGSCCLPFDVLIFGKVISHTGILMHDSRLQRLRVRLRSWTSPFSRLLIHPSRPWRMQQPSWSLPTMKPGSSLTRETSRCAVGSARLA